MTTTKDHVTNDDREFRARQIIIDYIVATQDTKAETFGGDFEAGVTDLLTDLMHFCNRKGKYKLADWDKCLERARRHFTDEVEHPA